MNIKWLDRAIVLVSILAFLLAILLSISLFNLFTEIQDVGLKHVLERVWEGKR